MARSDWSKFCNKLGRFMPSLQNTAAYSDLNESDALS